MEAEVDRARRPHENNRILPGRAQERLILAFGVAWGESWKRELPAGPQSCTICIQPCTIYLVHCCPPVFDVGRPVFSARSSFTSLLEAHDTPSMYNILRCSKAAHSLMLDVTFEASLLIAATFHAPQRVVVVGRPRLHMGHSVWRPNLVGISEVKSVAHGS